MTYIKSHKYTRSAGANKLPCCYYLLLLNKKLDNEMKIFIIYPFLFVTKIKSRNLRLINIAPISIFILEFPCARVPFPKNNVDIFSFYIIA